MLERISGRWHTRSIRLVLAVAAAFVLSGCSPAPDSSSVNIGDTIRFEERGGDTYIHYQGFIYKKAD